MQARFGGRVFDSLAGAAVYACVLVLLQWSTSAASEQQRPIDESGAGFLARIRLHTAAELDGVLNRAEMLYRSGELIMEQPIVFILHGEEGRVFLREYYEQNRALVNVAARLSALEVVDIKVCERWMRGQGLDRQQLLPFVGTVADGPSEIKRLRNDEQYRYF